MKKILVALAYISLPFAAHAQTMSSKTILPKGQFAWVGEAQTGKITVRVNLATQMAYVYSDDALIGLTSVSSGRDGYETPTGSFPILGKEVNHHSRHYDADMPYTEWLNQDGVALHAGGDPGARSSHGCVHLPLAFAATLFGITHVGDMVEVVDEAPSFQLAMR